MITAAAAGGIRIGDRPLRPGDIVYTGTPEGVIQGYPPERRVWLVNETFHQIYVFSNDGKELFELTDHLAASHPAGTFTLDGQGWPKLGGRWRIDGAEIEVTSAAGPPACAMPGRYRVDATGGGLTFAVAVR